MDPVRDLRFTDRRLVARYDTLNAGDHDRRFYEEASPEIIAVARSEGRGTLLA